MDLLTLHISIHDWGKYKYTTITIFKYIVLHLNLDANFSEQQSPFKVDFSFIDCSYYSIACMEIRVLIKLFISNVLKDNQKEEDETIFG